VVAVAVALRVPALIRPPGGPVVSINTYVELSTKGIPAAGERDEEGVPEEDDEPEAPDDRLLVGERLPVGVLVPLAAAAVGELEGVDVKEGVLDEVPEEVVVGEVDEEEPPDAVPVWVSLPLPVGDPLTVREPLGVLELVRVPDGVPDGVNVGDGVPDEEAPDDTDAVAEGVWEGVGSVAPITNRGPAYIVPALATEFHALVGNAPAVAPVHTLVSARMP